MTRDELVEKIQEQLSVAVGAPVMLLPADIERLIMSLHKDAKMDENTNFKITLVESLDSETVVIDIEACDEEANTHTE